MAVYGKEHKVPLKIMKSRNRSMHVHANVKIFFNENIFLQNCERVLSDLAK